MTIEEIAAELTVLQSQLLDKLTVPSWTDMDIRISQNAKCSISIYGNMKKHDTRALHTAIGDTPAEAIEKARAYIAALPSPEEAVTREYLGKVASAIDYATKHSIADEYVTPLRGVTMAMTDNLLTKEPNT